MLKRIVINKHIIRSNKKHGRNEPPISIQTYKGITRAHEALILGTSTLRYNPDKPLKCGATVWLETSNDVFADDEILPVGKDA